ncbi:dnaJ homolog subfamily C member 17 isoform X1 [Glycine max]|uniref:dnaJ homolog subfamily C member 17 isoform X1 n=1 Tax=Glycine max TaxID=3847 RepID=UPI001B357A79|nr:dnaJ homolog subfamily C member 17 isoform X1 [Glycine max]
MEAEMDHYAVLGLPSGEEGAKLTEKEINKAYRWKALELHPDKRPDDPNAAANFQQLRTSYDILRDDKARKLFDDLLRVKRERELRNLQRDGKRRKMVSDLERRERDANAPDPAAKEREEEARIARQLKEEIARIRAMHGKKEEAPAAAPAKEKDSGGSSGVDQEKVLKVSWEKVGEDYSADKLRELFSKFGEVEDVVIKGSKKKGSALVVMAIKEGAVAATGSVIGHLANPLLVVPLKPASVADSSSVPKSAETTRMSNLVGAGYQAFEDSVLKKLQKVCRLLVPFSRF